MWRTSVMLSVFALLGLPAAVVGIPWSAMQGNVRTMYGWAVGIVRLGLKAAGVEIRVVGMENVPRDRACIFLSNHVSNLDPPVLISVIPGQTSFLLMKSLTEIPLLGRAMLMGRFVPVARNQSREEAKRSTEAAANVIRDGIHITIYPEGTRSTDGTLLPFKKGGFFLAAETGAPLVPVIMRGTAAMWPKGTQAIRRGVATVEFLPAVEPEKFASREDLMRAVRESMEQALAR
jgi:1-acyl-sn-glycerol-3-phosphate acyltransferase